MNMSKLERTISHHYKNGEEKSAKTIIREMLALVGETRKTVVEYIGAISVVLKPDGEVWINYRLFGKDLDVDKISHLRECVANERHRQNVAVVDERERRTRRLPFHLKGWPS
jgi:hypothetical protein